MFQNFEVLLIRKIIKNKNATEGYEKQIGDQMRQDPTLWVVDPLTAVDNVLNRKCVHPSVNIPTSCLNIKKINL